MEELKKFATLSEPDPRWRSFVSINPNTHEITKYSLDERYRAIEAVTLLPTVPEDVRSQFNVARMLCLHAWFYYPFNQVSEMKAFSTVEMALHSRYPDVRGGMHALLGHAVTTGAIRDSGFSHVVENPNDPTEYSRTLATVVPRLRNHLAHGTASLSPHSVFGVRNCAEIINQLFRPSDA